MWSRMGVCIWQTCCLIYWGQHWQAVVFRIHEYNNLYTLLPPQPPLCSGDLKNVRYNYGNPAFPTCVTSCWRGRGPNFVVTVVRLPQMRCYICYGLLAVLPMDWKGGAYKNCQTWPQMGSLEKWGPATVSPSQNPTSLYSLLKRPFDFSTWWFWNDFNVCSLCDCPETMQMWSRTNPQICV